MKNKGFTLIELLAVIVILAIIALIATPIVLNIIKNTRESANVRSAEMYINGVELSIASHVTKNDKMQDGTYTINSDGNLVLGDTTYEIDMDGTKPSSGSLVIKNGKITFSKINISDNYFAYTGKSMIAVNEDTVCIRVSGNANSVGSKYLCDPGDNIYKNFYVMESNSTTTALIFDRNYTDDNVPVTMTWCNQSGSYPNSYACNHDGLDPYINYIQSIWTDVIVGLPNADKISKITGAVDQLLWASSQPYGGEPGRFSGWYYFGGSGSTYATWLSGPYDNNFTWLYNNLKDCTNYKCDVSLIDAPIAYWTDTRVVSGYGDSLRAYHVRNDGTLNYNGVSAATNSGIRPTITVDTSKIKN